MINIHLVNDEKFINQAVLDFDQHWRGQNFFIINKNDGETVKHVELKENVINFDLLSNDVLDYIQKITLGKTDVNLFIHFLRPEKLVLTDKLKGYIKFKTYWIFYGTDLYKHLFLQGKYQLYDNQSFSESIIFRLKNVFPKLYSRIYSRKENPFLTTFIEELDYFCFWNHYDFELLKKHYATKAEFKMFIYNAFSIPNFKLKETGKALCLINHSGSLSGNHLAVLKKLNAPIIKNEISELIVPLSYGHKEVILATDDFCRNNFPLQYKPMLGFLKKERYFDIIQKITVAFFGHRRQEAAANITYLLCSGTKIFLREDNNLYKFFKDMGIKIFSFENDFGSPQDLEVLDKDFQINNRKIILEKVSEQNIHNMYQNLVTK